MTTGSALYEEDVSVGIVRMQDYDTITAYPDLGFNLLDAMT